MLLLLAVTVLSAFGAELASVDVGGVTPTEFRTPGSWRLQANHLRVKVDLPAPVGTSGQLQLGVRYALEAVRSPTRPDGFPRMPPFHGGQVSLAGSKWWADGWVVYGQLTAGVAGDLERFDSGLTRYGGTVTVSRLTSRPWTLGAGLSVNHSFGRLLPVPLLLLSWTLSEHLSLDVVLPASAELTYTPWERTRVGVRAELFGNQLAIRDPELVTAFCGTTSRDCLDHLSYSSTSTRVYVGRRVRATWVQGYAGITALRRFALLSRDRAPLPDVGARLPAGILAGVSLHYAP